MAQSFTPFVEMRLIAFLHTLALLLSYFVSFWQVQQIRIVRINPNPHIF